MNKITILKIGLAGGIYNVLALLFVSIFAQTRMAFFGRFVMMTMQKYGPLGYNLSFSGTITGCIWAFLAGLVQFGLIALIFNILVSKNSFSGLFKMGKKE